MDCDTTGIEPDFSLVKFKKLAGGGYFKIVNQCVPGALKRLGYSDVQIKEIVSYVSGTNTFAAAPHASRQFLIKAGMTNADVEKAEKALARRVQRRPGARAVGDRHSRLRAHEHRAVRVREARLQPADQARPHQEGDR